MRKLKAVLLANAGMLEIVKNVTEIVAILIAATWAIYSFHLKDAPILETSARSFCELQIDSMNEKKCILKYVLHMKNGGVTSFDVDSVRISYWIIPNDTMLKSNYFSAVDYVKETAPDYSMLDHGFSYHYVPDKECIERYLFFVDKKPDCGILIKANFFIQGQKSFFSNEYFWDDTYSFRIHCVPGEK
ncbi:hypothetical protein A3860_11100 [Niastella vici]|uniref:Uncharacterized protein n=1 Tax=Niastella vici TaxID=1703345 RepID=A0A1V9FFG7_9BACT|nr:hypothetical protein [Niastella vici]OQP57104.1 hypothetical protein A3860_11100 [Niastella vici]